MDSFTAATKSTNCHNIFQYGNPGVVKVSRVTNYWVLSILFMLPTLLSGTILNVKQDGTGDFTLIQEAYLAASSGDTVLVYPGTYVENLHISNSKKITLASLFLTSNDRSYIKNTIINGNQSGSCIYIQNTDSYEIIISGFTLTNGSGQGEGLIGGGIFARNASSVSIVSNIITKNTAKAGGGIVVESSNVILSDNIISHNEAINGGGIMNGFESTILFCDSAKNSVYLNYAPIGADIAKSSYSDAMDIILDTCTILNPDYHFIYSYDLLNFPNNDISISVDHGKIEPVYHDLYVDPTTGNDSNDGLTPETALKTVSWACKLIVSDSTQPLNIYLLDGIYSPSTNQERFPFNGRSYVSLIGESRENTIFDADSSQFFYLSDGMQTNFSIKNLTLQNTYEEDNFDMICGGMYFLCCVDATVQNISVRYCQDNSRPGMGFDSPDKLLLKNLTFDHLKGGGVLGLGNSVAPGKTFRCENIAIRDFLPDDDPMATGGEGMGIGVSGNLYQDDRFTGSIINLQITDGLRIPDLGWGPASTVGLFFDFRAKVNLVNATIGNNTSRSPYSFAVNVDEGSLVNIYNTIMHGDSVYELNLGNYYGSYFPATANISYSNIEGGEDDIMNWQNFHTLNWLEGNMDENPQWLGTGDTAYYLEDDSPCINTGTPMWEVGMEPPYIREEDGRYVLYMHNMDTVHLPTTDLAGKPRISGGRIDMGAYEFQDTTTLIGEHPIANSDVYDLAVYPNPFYVHAFVDFKIKKQGKVRITICDINGQIVKTLLDATLRKGDYHLIWKGDNDYGTTLKTGLYLLNLWKGGETISTIKIVKEKY